MAANLTKPHPSKSVQKILELRKKTKPKIYFLIDFLVLITSLTIYHWENNIILIFLILSTILYGLALWIRWRAYVKMVPGESPENEDIHSLKHNLNIIKSALKTDYIVSIITLPSAYVMTIIIFETFASGDNFEIMNALKNRQDLLIVMILIGVGNFFMNEYNYRDDIKQLEYQITRSENSIKD